MDDEGDVWLTYAEAGQRLGVSPEAVRAKAIKRGWRRQHRNDGKTRVRLPFEPVDHPVNARSTPVRKLVDRALVHALEAHVETLKAQLAEETATLREHNATLKAETDQRGAEIDTFRTQLAARRQRARQRGKSQDRQAIAAFESLAQRLEAMAAASRPWWRRLVG
jgi:hypothetical protein